MPQTIAPQELELLSALFEGLAEIPFFVKDRDLRYVAANPAMARFCGLRNPGELIGKTAAEFFSGDLVRRYEAFDRQVLANGRPVSNRFDLSTVSGMKPTWILFSRIPVRGSDGEVLGIAASARQFRSSGRMDPVYSRVAKAARHIEEHFAEQLKLSDLARIAGVSVSQLERDFAHVLGETPHAAFNKVRINHALQLLESNLSISEIAHECGYFDHSAFTRRFREAMGVSPREHRALLRYQPEESPRTPPRSTAKLGVGKDPKELAPLVGFQIRRAFLASNESFGRFLEPLGLYPGQYGLLLTISENVGILATQAAEMLGLNPDTVGPLLIGLKDSRLIEMRAARDGKGEELYLTSAGKRAILKIRAVTTAHEDLVTANLSRAECETLVALLKKVRTAMASIQLQT